MEYGDDYKIGDVFNLGIYEISEGEMIEFAEKYDPQPYHLSADAGKLSIFNGLIASGWNTASIWMRLYVREMLMNSSVQGSPGVDELRWYSPVRPKDRLCGSVEIIGIVPHPFNRNLITVKKRGQLTRENETRPVMTLVLHSQFLRRPAPATTVASVPRR